jgi:predicted CXXCH cytochrome family protein
VYKGASAPTEYLAGGNFWWVKGPASGSGDPYDPTDWTGGQDDTKGHNIFLGEPDDYLSFAPGDGSGCNYSNFCHANLDTVDTSGVAGPSRQGCVKCHMMETSGARPKYFHHADDTCNDYDDEQPPNCIDPLYVVGANEQIPGPWGTGFDGFFRFLSGHLAGGGHGVCGIEDDDWQATSGSDLHNEYLGMQAGLNAPGDMGGGLSGEQGHTMTGYCSGCHGNFHISSDSEFGGDWIRHPAGAVLPDLGEFASYISYNPLVPVSRPDLTGWTDADSTVTPGIDLAMCLSCHRAHGSPYANMLRWDPTDPNGCAVCHTTKVTATQEEYHYVPPVPQKADCNVCHGAHGVGRNWVGIPTDPYDPFDPHDNQSLIIEKIVTPNSGDQYVVFPSGGASDYVRGAPDYNGICEVCHKTTKYYRNDGLGAEHPLYTYVPPDTVGVPVDPGWDCTSCHSHSNEFRRAANQIHAIHFVSDQGPLFPQDEDECYNCHANGRLQCADAVLFKSVEGPPQNLSDTDVCDSCHPV